MGLFLQLLPLLLSRAQADSGLSLEGRPGDRVNLSCVGVSYPIRWAWAPSFPACKGLSKGRRPILWASSRATPTVTPVQLFAGRLRALDPGIRQLELLLSAGDSGTFICRGRHEDESRTVIHVLGDGADCRAPAPSQGSVYPQFLIPLLGAGFVLGLGALSVVWWQHRACKLLDGGWRALERRTSETILVALKDYYTSLTGARPRTHFDRSPAPLVKAEPQRPVTEEEPKTAGDLDQEPSLLYADLDCSALTRPGRLSPVVPDASTIYAVVV